MNSQQVQAPRGDLRVPTVKLAHTIPEAQYASGLGRSTIYELVKQRKLRLVKAGRRSLILGLGEYLNSLEEAA